MSRTLVLQRALHFFVQAPDAGELLQRVGAQLQQAGAGRSAVVVLFFLDLFLDGLFLFLVGLGLLRVEFVLGIGVDQAIDDLVDAHLLFLDLFSQVEHFADRGRAGADGLDHVAQAFLDALRDFDLAFARQ